MYLKTAIVIIVALGLLETNAVNLQRDLIGEIGYTSWRSCVCKVPFCACYLCVISYHLGWSTLQCWGDVLMRNYGMTKAGCKEECDSTHGCLFASYGEVCRSKVHRDVSLHPETKGCCYLFKWITIYTCPFVPFVEHN